MRHLLIPVLLLALLAGCAGGKIGPHRIDVQQGNALDQENVARLKPGLNRSQVRFLLGTPLVIDPFRTDRWDYVYMYYKAGKLAEQKHVTLFFEGDTLARIEGDLPEPPVEPESTAQPEPAAQPAVSPPDSQPAEPRTAAATPLAAQPVQSEAPASQSTPAPAAPETAPPAPKPAPQLQAESSMVPPLPSPQTAPASVQPRPPGEMGLQPETDVAQIQPDVIPTFPEPRPAAAGSDDPLLKALNEWAAAWTRRDDDAYIAAYDASFLPQGGGSRADWEKRRRLLLGVAKNIDLRIDSPVVERAADGSATVTFKQFYRSDNYRDAVIKQLRMIERDGRWLIVEEKVLSVLRGAKP